MLAFRHYTKFIHTEESIFKGWFCNLNSDTVYLYFFAFYLARDLLLSGFITESKSAASPRSSQAVYVDIKDIATLPLEMGK